MTEETIAKIRRYNSNIEAGGKGVIAFGIWTVIKTFITIILDSGFVQDSIRDVAPEYSDIYLQGTIVVIISVCIMILILNSYVGLCAIRYGRGNRKNKRFVFWTVVLAVIYWVFVVSDLNNIAGFEFREIAELMADLTLLFILADILYSMHMARITVKKEQS
ncbi:hypothetical protein [Butyrivibrio sp. JL13D10]|uniref:hypothetical protein n=1 Tax=Butyrivibrio sp. JL13D10 TaxID=3236815 RepID=UPI0038B6A88D